MATADRAEPDNISAQATAEGATAAQATAAQATSEGAPSGTITFLFTDIEGSTRLLERLRAGYADVLADQRKLLRKSFARWHGHEVDTQGDAFFVAFPRAADALRCAVDAQRALSLWPWPEGVTVRVRMGLHTGEPELAATGYVGMDVHRAARIAGAAHGGQIVLSGTTRDLVTDELPVGLGLRDLGSHRLKDLRGEIRLYQVETEGLEAAFPPLQTAAAEDPPPTPGEPPFRGLQAFEEADAGLFFGREEVVERLVGELNGVRFMALIGASGSGKSSILRAGLIPALRAATPAWRIHLLTPTAHPLEALAGAIAPDASPADLARLTDDLRRDTRSLAHALRRPADLRAERGHRTLVAVDQLEELFTLCRDETERQAFLDNLARACGLDEFPARTAPAPDRATVVVTLRADFYAYLAPYDLVRDAAAAAQAYVGPMSAAELRRAIEEPARQGDWTIVPGLVDLLLRDVGDEPGALPLLSHALLETWRRRRGTTLTLRSYAESGEVKGAIARTADRTYERELNDEQRVLARDLFLRLTELGEGTQDTRRRVRLAQLLPVDPAGAAAVRSVIGTLADARLITVGEDDVEVAHEALIREWPTLRGWIEVDRETLRTRRRIADGAAEWERLGRDDEALLRGTRLAEASEILATDPMLLNESERRFAEASVARQSRERASRERARRTLTAVAFALAGVFFVVAAGAGVLWFRSEEQRSIADEQRLIAEQQRADADEQRRIAEQQRQNADEQRMIAEQREQEANEQQHLALSRQLATDAGASRTTLDLSLLLSVEATRLADTVEAKASVLASLLVEPQLVSYLNGHTEWISGVAFTPDGRTLASGSGDGTIILWDVERREAVGEPLNGHAAWISSITFSPDGGTLASGSGDGTIILWDVERREPLGEPLSAQTEVTSVAFSPDGRFIASGLGDGQIVVWDLAQRAPIGEPLSGHEGSVGHLAFSPDGRTLASGSDDGRVILWDLDLKQPIGDPLTGHTDWISGVAFSPDGSTLVSSSGEGTIILWDAVGHTPIGEPLSVGELNVNQMAFSQSGTIAAGLGDGTIRLWDAERREWFGLPLEAHSPISALAFDPDGRMLASGGDDSTLLLWDVERRERIGVPLLAAGGAAVHDAAFSPDGRTIASAGDDGTVGLWDVARRERIGEPLTGHTAIVRSVAFSHDGRKLASSGDDGSIILWDVERREPVGAPLAGLFGRVGSVAFGAGDRTLAAGSRAGVVELWDVEQGQFIEDLTLIDVIGAIRSVAFTADGQTLAAGSDNGRIILWDVARHASIGQPLFAGRVVNRVAFSPDDRTLASANDGGIILWDVATREQIGRFGQAGDATSLAFSPDGEMVAAGSTDGSIILWDVGGAQVGTFSHGASVTSLAFSPDGATLLSAGSDGSMILWDVSLDSWREVACQVAGRDLTPDEWTHYLGTEEYHPTCSGQ